MLLTLQSFVRQRFFPLMMGLLAVGFLLLLGELIGYQHFEGLQLIGTGAVVLGLLASLLGIGARGGLRRGLIYVFLVLALTGLLGEWEHNEDRLRGESGPPTGQDAGAQTAPPAGEANQFRIPPPVLAPLSVSGLCLFGAVMLLVRRDSDEADDGALGELQQSDRRRTRAA